jgi:hypothetical protein
MALVMSRSSLFSLFSHMRSMLHLENIIYILALLAAYFETRATLIFLSNPEVRNYLSNKMSTPKAPKAPLNSAAPKSPSSVKKMAPSTPEGGKVVKKHVSKPSEDLKQKTPSQVNDVAQSTEPKTPK